MVNRIRLCWQKYLGQEITTFSCWRGAEVPVAICVNFLLAECAPTHLQVSGADRRLLLPAATTSHLRHAIFGDNVRPAASAVTNGHATDNGLASTTARTVKNISKRRTMPRVARPAPFILPRIDTFLRHSNGGLVTVAVGVPSLVGGGQTVISLAGGDNNPALFGQQQQQLVGRHLGNLMAPSSFPLAATVGAASAGAAPVQQHQQAINEFDDDDGHDDDDAADDDDEDCDDEDATEDGAVGCEVLLECKEEDENNHQDDHHQGDPLQQTAASPCGSRLPGHHRKMTVRKKRRMIPIRKVGHSANPFRPTCQ